MLNSVALAILYVTLVLLVSPGISKAWSKTVVPNIVGGEPAKKNELPYQVSLKFQRKHDCGATVLNAKFIITAAHCVEFTETDYEIVAGEHDITSDTDGTEQFRNVEKIIIHPGYDRASRESDIALLRLSIPLTLNSAVAAVTLPSPGHTATGNGLISGWGFLEEDGAPPAILHKVTLPIITDEICREAYGELEITDSMICAGFEEGGKDSCQGDSGGPLIAYDQGAYLAGIISWGNGCANPGYPGVYTEVSYFIDWIKSHMVD